VTGRLLHVEPHDLLAKAMQRWFEIRGWQATRAVGRAGAFARLEAERFDAVITHYGKGDPVAPAIVDARIASGIPVRVLSGAIDCPALSSIWIAKPGLDRLETFLAELRARAA